MDDRGALVQSDGCICGEVSIADDGNGGSNDLYLAHW